MEQDDDLRQMESQHKNYLNKMIAEQEAALSRFQHSAYLSESSNNTFSSSVGARPSRPSSAARDESHSALHLSASASPYTFGRGQSASARTFTAAPTPGYTRARASSPTLSSSSGGSGSSMPNHSLMDQARRTLADANWHDGGAAANANAAAIAHSRSRNISSSSVGLSHGGGLNDTALSTATLTSEVEAKMWNKDKLAWEKRMAELEDRLKRVNGAATPQVAATNSTPPPPLASSQYNVAVVNGRGIQAGIGGALALPSALVPNTTSHNVHTSGLVLRLEQELATAVEALVRERQNTATREASFTDRLAALEEELAARDRKAQQTNAKWMEEFETQSRDYQAQLEKALGKTQQVVTALEEKEREHSNRVAEVKRVTVKAGQVESDLRESHGQVEELRAELERQLRRGKELELHIQQLEFDKKSTLADMESKAKSFAQKIERQKEDWVARFERQKDELASAHEKELRASRQELAELERKWREVEHDAFILSGDLNKWKDLCASRELELEKAKSVATMDRTTFDATLRSERETTELQTRTTVQKIQAALDETQAMLMDTTSKLEAEVRRGKESASRIESLESDLRTRTSERDAALTARDSKVAAAQTAAQESERSSQNHASMVASLRHGNEALREELQMLQKKLDARATSKGDELRNLETDYKAYREKTRARIDELEQVLEEVRSKSAALESRNDALKHDFDRALTAATSDQAETIRALERKRDKLSGKLSTKVENATITASEKDRMISALRSEVDRRAHAESLALHQLAELEARFKKERTRSAELETKLNHVLATSPDAATHQRVLAELVAAKQVATNIQGRYREVQARFERQSVRQNALQQLLNRLQDEQNQNMYRVPAKTYLATPNLPLYSPLHSYPPHSSAAGGTNYDDAREMSRSLDRARAGVGSNAVDDFSREEEDMYRVLMRDQERKRRVRQHVRAYARGDVSSDDDLDTPAVRSSYGSRTRSRSVPRDSRDSWAGVGSSPSRTRDDADVNVNLKVNFDPRVLKRVKELDLVATCVHADNSSGAKPHDSRSCKVCQRRAFGRGMDHNQHYAPDQHIPTRGSPVAKAKMPHT